MPKAEKPLAETDPKEPPLEVCGNNRGAQIDKTDRIRRSAVGYEADWYRECERFG